MAHIWSYPASTAHIVEQLSAGRTVRLSHDVEQRVLRRLVDQRRCPVCNADPGALCLVYGGFQGLMRTHPQRLAMTRQERKLAVALAVRQAQRARAGTDVSDDLFDRNGVWDAAVDTMLPEPPADAAQSA